MEENNLLFECAECGSMLPMDRMQHSEDDRFVCYQCKRALEMGAEEGSEGYSDDTKKPGIFSRIFNWGKADDDDDDDDGDREEYHEVKPEPKPVSKVVQDPNERVKLVCNACKYRFSLKRQSNYSMRCPYCGKGTVSEDRNTAENLLREVSEMDLR